MYSLCLSKTLEEEVEIICRYILVPYHDWLVPLVLHHISISPITLSMMSFFGEQDS